MGLMDILSRRPKPVAVRHKYDKVREKVDKLPRIEKRIELLKLLDQLEPQIVMMEEHHMNNFELRKTADYINYSLKRVNLLMSQERAKKELIRR